jgi:hypothetical protein
MLGRRLLPGHILLCRSALAVWGALFVALCASRRARELVPEIAHVVSIVLLAFLAAELFFTWHDPPREDLFRYAYPYRMQGAAPLRTFVNEGKTIHTNDTGLRMPGAVERKKPGEFRVLVLGGSAVFGVISSDDETIPALLEGFLREKFAKKPLSGVTSLSVVNAGQGWFNSTQELVFFVTELALYEPDVIVAVDGYNDIHHAVEWNARPPVNPVTRYMLAFFQDEGAAREPSWTDSLASLLGGSALLRRIGVNSALLLSRLPPQMDNGAPSAGPPDFMPLVEHRLIANWVLLDRLGKAFHCPVLVSLQPVIYTKAKASPEEREWLRTAAYAPKMTKAWNSLNGYAEEQSRRLDLKFFHADKLVRNSSENLFHDYCHLYPPGNKLVARQIAEDIAAEFKRWPWRADWTGVRYPFLRGDPIWRPNSTDGPGEWR